MKSDFLRQYVRYVAFVMVVALVATICFVVPDFWDNPVSDIKGIATIFVYVVALGVLQFILLSLICLNRWICTLLIPLYAIGGAIVSYYRVAYNATITPMMVDVTLHTNMGTVAGVVSLVLVGWIMVNAVWAIAVVVYRWRFIKLNREWVVLLVCLITLAFYYGFSSRLRQSSNQRYPMNVVVSVAEYWRIENERGKPRVMPNVYGTIDVDTIDVILVIGEAMRADHLSLNGYQRMTCPNLEKVDNLVSLKNVYTEYTYTAASVPHILTAADSLNPQRAYTNYSLIECLHQYGFNSTWISNQDYGRTYSSFIQEADTAIFPNADKSVFVFHPWYDEDLLTELDKMIVYNRIHAKNLYVLHCIGSHWYYNNHVPKEMQIFQPITTERVAKQNTVEQICNSYDNTVVYMDYVMSQLIETMHDRTCIVFYLSDHGEALGEEGAYLHANDAYPTHFPAAFVWYSDKYATVFPQKIEILQTNREKHYRTDYLFYSILSSVGLKTEGRVDLFSR